MARRIGMLQYCLLSAVMYVIGLWGGYYNNNLLQKICSLCVADERQSSTTPKKMDYTVVEKSMCIIFRLFGGKRRNQEIRQERYFDSQTA